MFISVEFTKGEKQISFPLRILQGKRLEKVENTFEFEIEIEISLNFVDPEIASAASAQFFKRELRFSERLLG